MYSYHKILLKPSVLLCCLSYSKLHKEIILCAERNYMGWTNVETAGKTYTKHKNEYISLACARSHTHTSTWILFCTLSSMIQKTDFFNSCLSQLLVGKESKVQKRMREIFGICFTSWRQKCSSKVWIWKGFYSPDLQDCESVIIF